MYIVNDDIPLGCVYEGENGKTKYCPMLNHYDVPYCQYLEDDEAAIGIDERPVYCPIVELSSADVQPRKTAEWVYGEKDGADGWYCSECKFHIPWYYDYYGLKNIDFIRDFHTCPHCDAKMMKYTGMKE